MRIDTRNSFDLANAGSGSVGTGHITLKRNKDLKPTIGVKDDTAFQPRKSDLHFSLQSQTSIATSGIRAYDRLRRLKDGRGQFCDSAKYHFDMGTMRTT